MVSTQTKRQSDLVRGLKTLCTRCCNFLTTVLFCSKNAKQNHNHHEYITVHVSFPLFICLYIFPAEWSDLCARHRGGRWWREWRDPLWWSGVCRSHWHQQRSSKIWLDQGCPGELYWVMMDSLCFIEARSLCITVTWQEESPCAWITQRGRVDLSRLGMICICSITAGTER